MVLPAAAYPYAGTWTAFYPDLSGVVNFAAPDEAYEYALTRSAWVVFLAYGVDLAELIAQIVAAHHHPGGHP